MIYKTRVVIRENCPNRPLPATILEKKFYKTMAVFKENCPNNQATSCMITPVTLVEKTVREVSSYRKVGARRVKNL